MVFEADTIWAHAILVKREKQINPAGRDYSPVDYSPNAMPFGTPRNPALRSSSSGLTSCADGLVTTVRSIGPWGII